MMNTHEEQAPKQDSSMASASVHAFKFQTWVAALTPLSDGM